MVESRLHHLFRETRFGPVAVLWSDCAGKAMIDRIVLSRPGLAARRAVRSLFPGSVPDSCPAVDAVADRVAAFLSGEDIRFSLDIVRIDLCSPFQQKVLRAEHGIPRGSVSTYLRIARHIGDARAARAAGMALARNPFPIIVPCHRAIRSDGALGGFQGGIEMKRTLLKMEGVDLDASGRVIPGRFVY